MRRSSIGLAIVMMAFSLGCSLTAGGPPSEPGMAPAVLPLTPESPSVQPTEAPVPQATVPTPGPTSLNPEGPYVMFESYGGIWIANPDGSFPARVSDVGLNNPLIDLHRAVAPTGDRLAMVRTTDDAAELVILHLPEGQVDVVAQLAARPAYDNLTSAEGLAFHDIVRYDNVAWQPGDGRLLAFVGAMDGPTADLYVYDTVSGETTQLTNGPSQALFPTWSPDGAYILHFGGSWVEPLGGALNEYTRPDGAWAVRIEDGAILTQPGSDYRHSNFLGWLDGGHYLISHADEGCVHRNIDSVGVADGKRARVFEGCFDGYQGFSPGTGAVLLSSSACDACPSGEGTFLIVPGEAAPRTIWTEKAWEIDWLPESEAFDVYPLGAVSGDGRRFDPPVAEPSLVAVSKAGWIAWLALEGEGYRVHIGTPGDESTVLDVPLGALIWDPVDGNTLLGSTNGKVYAARAPAFDLQEAGVLGESADQSIWVP